MRFPLHVRLDARLDAAQITSEYALIRPELGLRFKRQLDIAFDAIEERPASFAIILKRRQVRRVLLDDFPY